MLPLKRLTINNPLQPEAIQCHTEVTDKVHLQNVITWGGGNGGRQMAAVMPQ